MIMSFQVVCIVMVSLFLVQILVIGKSINFLRRRCHDRSQPGDQSLRNWFRNEDGKRILQVCVMNHDLLCCFVNRRAKIV